MEVGAGREVGALDGAIGAPAGELGGQVLEELALVGVEADPRVGEQAIEPGGEVAVAADRVERVEQQVGAQRREVVIGALGDD
ncbi:MAG TPA: hypothetical protein VM734_29475, partial [Kofleriaceae bacterium]|nr:hypothetical protein [Kofleriaceae bacterium]